MAVGLSISNITFNDGSSVVVKPNDILVFTGGNNVGKSVALRNIGNLYSNIQESLFNVVSQVDVHYFGSAEDAYDVLAVYFPTPQDHIIVHNHQIRKDQLQSWWGHPGGASYYAAVFLKTLFTDRRITASDPQQTMDFSQSKAVNPIHRLFQRDHLEEELSALFREAFNMDLVVNRQAGSNITLHVGQRPTIDPSDKYLTRYHEAVRKLPLLYTQGDGMRSFVSILLELMTGSPTVFLLDEPEAFLHPPQIKLLATYIVTKFPAIQLVVATHSADFIKGLLEKDTDRVSIVNIQRNGVHNHAAVIDNVNIQAIWKDPFLKYSSIFEGLFHDKVIVCESDGDCRFFSALLEVAYQGTADYHKIPDTLFIPAYGKAKIPSIVSSLRSISVTTATVCDFDIFNNEQPLRALVEAHGGDWSKVEPYWKVFYTAVNQEKAQLDRTEVKDKLLELLGKSTAASLNQKEIDQLKATLKASSAWSYAKRQGIDFLPAGDARKACEATLTYLNSIGIFPLRVGELESFDKTIGNGNKANWLEEVLKKDLGTGFAEAKAFLTAVLNYR